MPLNSAYSPQPQGCYRRRRVGVRLFFTAARETLSVPAASARGLMECSGECQRRPWCNSFSYMYAAADDDESGENAIDGSNCQASFLIKRKAFNFSGNDFSCHFFMFFRSQLSYLSASRAFETDSLDPASSWDFYEAVRGRGCDLNGGGGDGNGGGGENYYADENFPYLNEISVSKDNVLCFRLLCGWGQGKADIKGTIVREGRERGEGGTQLRIFVRSFSHFQLPP